MDDGGLVDLLVNGDDGVYDLVGVGFLLDDGLEERREKTGEAVSFE